MAVVEALYEEYAALIAHLDEHQQPSLRISVDNNFRKALLLAAASYFETRVCSAIMDHSKEIAGEFSPVTHLLRNKAISRQYHTFFNWESRNANSFFGLFGEHFAGYMREDVEREPELRDAVRAFLEVGQERNRLVHQDFGSYSLEKTASEIYALYEKALPFLERIPKNLKRCPTAPGSA